MSVQEKRALMSLITGWLIGIGYFLYVYQSNQALGVDWANDYQTWAKILLVYIPITIGIRILVHIIFVIFIKVSTGEEVTDRADELERLIYLRANRNGHFSFMIGFLLAFILLANDMPIGALFITFIISGFISELITELSTVFYYRRGI